jgi:hypothetical protein
MTGQKRPDQSISDEVFRLLDAGYGEELRKYTRSIENRPSQVIAFERVFHALNDSAAIHWEGTADQDSFFSLISESHDGLMEFLAGMSNERCLGTFLTFLNHATQITAEFGWLDSMAGRVVWDRWVGHVDDPVMAFADIGFLFDRRDYRCEPPIKEPPEPPLYRYHPERFKAFHSCGDQIGRIYRHKVDARSGMLTVDLLNELMTVVTDEFNDKTMRYPRRLTVDAPSPSLAIESLETLVTAYGRFVQAGRQVIDFPPALIEMLVKTDADDIPLDSIKTPYASQYLYFGPQPDMELEPGWFVDGAYVEVRGEPGDIRFTVTASPVDRQLSRLWYVYPEPEYTQDFVGEYRKMDLATAMDTVLSDRMSTLNNKLATAGGDITDQVRDGLQQHDLTMPEHTRVVDVGPTMAGKRLAQVNRRHPIFHAALQLVVNALCYITAYPDDIDTVWPDGTPASLRIKVESGKGKEVMRAKSKLAALGYVPVHICGKRIGEQRDKVLSAARWQSHPSTHWRRGHWRNQVHGPGRMLRKLIWVMPVLVGGDQKHDPEAGHLYLVS